jgi:voltage-gated potassium channel
VEQTAGTRPSLRWWLYEGLLAMLAVVTLALLARPDTGWVRATNLLIWAVFAADYVVRLVRAPDKRAFVRANIPDLIAALPLDLLRVARLAKLARVVRAGGLLWRVTRDLRAVVATNGLNWLLLLSSMVVASGGLAAWVLEDEFDSFGDALWWSIVTATTVGYGDMSPPSTEGRIVAGILMFVGIGTLGMITATLATYFVAGRDHGEGANEQVAWLRDQLARWDDLDPDERRRLAAMLTGLAQMDTEEDLTRPGPAGRSEDDTRLSDADRPTR